MFNIGFDGLNGFLLPTDNTDNTKFFFSQQITLITQIIFREIRCFDNHQTNQMNQTIHLRQPSGSSGLSGDKEKINSCNLCHLLTKKDNQVHLVYLVTKTSVKSVQSDVKTKNL